MVGKVFNYKGGKNLDIYGKFFYTKRDGVEYDAPQHYDLDSVASSVLRIGARYGTTDKKWNWYGGKHRGFGGNVSVAYTF